MLFYMGGYSHKEIAAFLDLPTQTINNRLYASRKRLKKRMMAMVEDDLHTKRPSKDDRFAQTVALFLAIEAGQPEKVNALLDTDSTLVQCPDSNGQTLLHRAAYYGHEGIVRLLLDRGAPANARDQKNRTPLHQLACLAQIVEVAQILLAGGAEIDAEDEDGNTPLALAALRIDHRKQGSWGPPWWFARFLQKQGARPDVFSATILDKPDLLRPLLMADPTLVHVQHRGSYLPSGWTPLHHAADRGSLESAKLLLEYGAKTEARDAEGHTPLYRAGLSCAAWIEREFHDCHDVFDLLVQRGAELDLFTCAAAGKREQFDQLLATDPDQIRQRDAVGNTPLHLAALSGQGDLVSHLLEHGADADCRNQAGETPLDLAAKSRCLSVVHHWGEQPIPAILDNLQKTVEALIQRQAQCNAFTAAALGWHERLDTLLNADPALLEDTSPNHRSLLRHSCRLWQWQGGEALQNTVKLLLERGAPPDIWTGAALGRPDLVQDCLVKNKGLLHALDQDLTPLHCAAMMGQTEMVAWLLEQGASPDSRGQWGGTPLHLTAWAGHQKVAKVLLDGGADLEAKAAHGATPLALAAKRGQHEVTELLLERGANLEARTSYGGTPLDLAIMANSVEIALDFVRRGANLEAADYAGYTPLSSSGDWGNGLLHWAAQRGDRPAGFRAKSLRRVRAR